MNLPSIISTLYYGKDILIDHCTCSNFRNGPAMTSYRYFQHANFIPIVGVGKRGEYYWSVVICQGSTRSELH